MQARNTGVKCALITAVLLFSTAGPALAEPCEVSSNSDGVSLCQTPVESSSFARVRGETELCVSTETMLVVLTDIPGFANWMPNVSHSELLADEQSSQVYYIQNKAPWPMKPRDMAYRSTLVVEEASNAVHITITGIPAFLEEKNNAVRLLSANGGWNLLPLSESPARLRAAFYMHVEPGSIPATLANRRLRQTVGGALENLQQRFACVESE